MTETTARPGSSRDDLVVIGIDVGTTNSKAVAARADGTVLAEARLAHEVSTPHPGWVEHDAEAAWWGDTVTLCRGLLSELGAATRVAAVAVTTCGPCLVPVDADGGPLRPGILYGVDTRASDEIATLERTAGVDAILALSRVRLTSQHVGPKLAWVAANEPDVAARTATWHTATSFIVARLTGQARIDHHQATFFAPFIDADDRAWDLRYAGGLDLDGRLPALAWPGDIAGTVTEAAASVTGLLPGTRVLVGTSDGPMEALAVGALRPGIVALTHGSTTTLTTFAARPFGSATLWESEGWSPDERCIAAGLSTSGAIVSWLHRIVTPELAAGDQDALDAAEATLAAKVATSPPGANGLLVLPYFSGERTPFADPLARGVIAGLTLQHTRADLHRAVREGIAFGVRHLLEAFEEAGVPVEALRAAGGATRDPIALQIVSDVTGRTQSLARASIGASYGAAYLAARAVGMVRVDDGTGDGWFVVERTVTPDPETSAAYDRGYDLFRQLYRDTRPVVHALASGASGHIEGAVT